MPHVYIVYWGWGEKGAFPSTQSCTAQKLTYGKVSATLKCDPDGAGKYMADWVNQLGGTQWAGEQTQYYQTVTDSSGNAYDQHIANPTNQLSGIWVDDANSITGLPKTSGSNPAGPDQHLHRPGGRGLTGGGALPRHRSGQRRLRDRPAGQLLSDPNALSTGYCAFHDYVYPGFEGGIYDGLTKGISYTNMPYALSINSGGANVCGENAVNSGAAGKLDGFSIVLGHEIEETVTDPGAEDILGSGTAHHQPRRLVRLAGRQ